MNKKRARKRKKKSERGRGKARKMRVKRCTNIQACADIYSDGGPDVEYVLFRVCQTTHISAIYIMWQTTNISAVSHHIAKYSLKNTVAKGWS